MIISRIKYEPSEYYHFGTIKAPKDIKYLQPPDSISTNQRSSQIYVSDFYLLANFIIFLTIGY